MTTDVFTTRNTASRSPSGILGVFNIFSQLHTENYKDTVLQKENYQNFKKVSEFKNLSVL
ncbi:MAG TPA: hypothetical protein VF610_05580 [Segetibacter sp.]|jgi:hypothetical protein